MYKKVLYNIKKMKKCVGRGRGKYLNQNTLYVFRKRRRKKKVKKKKKKLTEPGFEPTTSGLEIHYWRDVEISISLSLGV